MNAEIRLTPAQVHAFRTWADPNPDGIPMIREELIAAVDEHQRDQMVAHVVLTGRAPRV